MNETIIWCQRGFHKECHQVFLVADHRWPHWRRCGCDCHGQQTIEFDLEDRDFAVLCRLAQQAQLTFDDLVAQILREYLEREGSGSDPQ